MLETSIFAMNFRLIDRIVELDPGKRIVAVKAVSLSEEYLAEHFPNYPVLPGVFMLECMAEAAGWLARDALDFAISAILLESVRGVTYKNFVLPGQLLRVEVKCLRMAPQESGYSGIGVCEGKEVVKGRFSLRHFDLQSRAPNITDADRRVRDEMQKRWSMLRQAQKNLPA